MHYRFVDCRYELGRPERGRELYRQAHIPGASFLDLDTDLSDLSVSGAGRHPLPSPERFAQAATRAGIGEDTFVVAYGDGAARLWWLLRHFEHDDCSVLEGGLSCWRGPLVSGEEAVAPTRFVPRPRAGDTIAAEELLERLGEPGLVVVDARAPERYRGEVEPIDPVAGHIPGAVNWPFADAGTVPAELLGARELVVYCGSGVSACVDLHALALAGRPDAKLYPGSWSDWSTRGFPVEPEPSSK
jgi:thiosulfate/3-mercaptopyruvate sulfurtransferase